MTTVRFAGDHEYASRLRDAGFRATFGRVKLLEFLAKARQPMRVEVVAKAMQKHMDQATVYRSLEALGDKGLVRRVDLGHAHTHYEYQKGQAHPHQMIAGLCRTCVCI